MIDARIGAIMNFVRAGSRVADVGADHGYLSIALVENNLAAKVIATEKNLGPFEVLSKNISGDKISAGEVDTICIAGMGGALIQKILSDAPEVVSTARQLILQPMNAAEKIRTWLAENSWAIADEDLAESGDIIYEIICAEKNPFQKIFKRETSPLREKFLTQRLEKLQRVLNEISKSSDARASEKFLRLQAELDTLRRL